MSENQLKCINLYIIVKYDWGSFYIKKIKINEKENDQKT